MWQLITIIYLSHMNNYAELYISLLLYHPRVTNI